MYGVYLGIFCRHSVALSVIAVNRTSDFRCKDLDKSNFCWKILCRIYISKSWHWGRPLYMICQVLHTTFLFPVAKNKHSFFAKLPTILLMIYIEDFETIAFLKFLQWVCWKLVAVRATNSSQSLKRTIFIAFPSLGIIINHYCRCQIPLFLCTFSHFCTLSRKCLNRTPPGKMEMGDYRNGEQIIKVLTAGRLQLCNGA